RDLPDELASALQPTRRYFFSRCGLGLGALALSTLLERDGLFASAGSSSQPFAPREPHHRPRAKNVIYLFMAGGPSQLELFDEKPVLRRFHGSTPPKEFMEGKRFAFLKPDATLLGPIREFGRYGNCGATLSDLLPHHRKIVDKVCFIRSMQTDVFNHGPAKIFMNTGSPQPGRPSMGSWVTYGIGSESRSLPGFVVLQSGPRGPRAGATLWSSGFLPTTYQGVPFRGRGDPILYLSNPAGFSREHQRGFIDAVRDLNRRRLDVTRDPEIETRIHAYEMAYRMQMSAPELVDLSHESTDTLELYGAEPGKPSYALNCLLARRLIERGVRFVQLYHTNWDHHGGPGERLDKDLERTARDVDQASAALVIDLERRGLLDDTLVIWGGEFGRTPMGEVRETVGRDHHIDAYTLWLAGAGVRPGLSYGASDELGLGVTENPVHVHDLQATILWLLGFDHERLTYRFQGRDFRLTDVHGRVVHEIIS
ncbi:MAG TPA: DUF1501 domain-containing protein, partial [Planctomycetota bacterium]|nr:DUF1501 domain-containing protein [Planctomycetota bacterium]